MSKKILFLGILVCGINGFLLFMPAGNQAIYAAGTLDVSVSAEKLMQGDSLLVAVRNEPGKVTGTFGSLPLHFIRNDAGTGWIALVGMPVKKIPGAYVLRVHAPGKVSFRKTIPVLKRKFPVTVLAVTPELEKKGYTPKSIVNNVSQKDNKQLGAAVNTKTPAAYFSKPFVYPLSEITVTGDFGDIRKSGKYSIQHMGVDLKAPVGTPVRAVNNGKVVFTGSLPDYGDTLAIDHGLGVYSMYLHLSESKVVQGQMVEQGDTIALSGNTGYSLGPHLHLSIRVRGASLDPLRFIHASQSLPW